MYREDFDKGYQQEKGEDDVYSKPVRAGKRTYFFDVKATRGNKDFFLTITESKRKVESDGNVTYNKHKIFLYKEDFEKFQEGLSEVIEYIKNDCLHEAPIEQYRGEGPENESSASEDDRYSKVDFEEL